MLQSFIEKLLVFLRIMPAPEFETSAAERRVHDRFQYSYSVTIHCDLKKFETVCTDISLGGMKLKHPLPPSMIGKQCKVSIADNLHREPIVFNSTVIADTLTPKRISFSATEPEAHARLKSWLKQRVISDLMKQESAD
ncbi:MAG: hypothetical protein A2Z97_04720 [Bdellovibrionales bacterium GWB1_52_6]|nr:MAG: hypothetical protein A2Z97_04720 [Bdellovibrionales bacterium GWB1_52_6]OFZ05557.1 MAG: hypothetical protein A2X97_11860 [Bdellovibrionales bacterium GWA1_52_35]